MGFAVQVFYIILPSYKQSADFQFKICLSKYVDDHIHDMVIILGLKSSMENVMRAKLGYVFNLKL